MIHFFIPASSTVITHALDGDEAVRRILCYSTGPSSSNLLYKGENIATFNSNNNINIEFESYYGFPKISDFSLEVSSNISAIVLVDVLPYSDSTDDYITTRSAT
jgi:UDP-N-acetylglucosamine pyrophosphorylase